MHRDEALVDDRGLVPGCAVDIGEDPAAKHPGADRVEIAGAHAQHRDLRRPLTCRRRTAINRQLPHHAAEHRRVAGDRTRLDGPHMAQALFELSIQPRARLGARVFRQRQRHPHRQEMGRVDAQVRLIEHEEAPHHESGARQEDQRQDHFDNDEGARPAAGAHPAASAAAASLFQDLVHVGFGDMQRRREPEEHSGPEADGGKEREHDLVHRERHPVRLADAGGGHIEQSHAPRRQAETQNAAQDREQHALDEQLPDDAPAAGAQGDTHRDFARSLGGTRQQQIGHVRARDQQHERDGAHQREEDQLDLRAGHAIVERHDARAHVFVGRRVFLHQPLCDVLELGSSLL